jgi:hypothetical protein
MLYAIAFQNTITRQIFYYTGKAGDYWLSSDSTKAFFGYSLEGVRNVGEKLLRQHCITLEHCELLPVINPNATDDTEGGSCD